MNRVDLVKLNHDVKIGDCCNSYTPNITEDSIFYDEGIAIGFYIKEVKDKLKNFVNIANAELLSDRVPKSEMSRGPQGDRNAKIQRAKEGKNLVTQYSTIIGSIAPKPQMRRPYPSISSVHQVKTADIFIKAMLLACKESEKLIEKILPELYKNQKNLIKENVPENFRFCDLFTSSISNYNISADFHRDVGNIIGCSNVIITKKKNARGGNLRIPDYDVTIDSKDNSMLVYPAWKNIHGVTPIEPIDESGYRNSLIFYPLKGFKTKVKESFEYHTRD